MKKLIISLEKKGLKLSVIINAHTNKYSVNGKLFKTLKQIAKDCDRDYYLSSEEAKTYGLIDSVIENKKTK